MTLDLKTLQAVRAEMQSKTREWDGAPKDTEAFSEILTYIDTEIAKAKNHD